ncbi:MAG: hypothetical protein JNM44_05980 [Chitinophagaceae bacterium]|nr:hypothetical protein [Chitinophagaceae bacterium]
MKFRILASIILAFTLSHVKSQTTFPYQVELQPKTIPNMPGIQAFAFAQHQGKWLIVGGRTDGLHARQPFNAFPASGSNTAIWVVDPVANTLWTSPLQGLSANLTDHLQSTNMNFYQDEDTLYFLGGYGLSSISGSKITFPYLTAIHVSGLMNAVINGTSISGFFKQIEDNRFAITGGRLGKIQNEYLLVGGHQFDGNYNPMGNPTYTQTYSNAIRRFRFNNSGAQLSFTADSTWADAVHLHRRDYNLLPQVFPNGEEGYTLSSGVFQVTADLPYLYPVEITATGYQPVTSFNQYLSHYHTAYACLWDSLSNEMHSFLFGGMSQYYYQNGTLIQDQNVPFVKTISRLHRNAQGILTEYQVGTLMPGYLGSASEFIPNLNLPHKNHELFRMDDFLGDTIRLGYILGGISSPTLNPFTNNQTNQTAASPTLYEVRLTRDPLSQDVIIPEQWHWEARLVPNPISNPIKIQMTLPRPASVEYILLNALGQIMQQGEFGLLQAGEHSLNLSLKESDFQGILEIILIADRQYYKTLSANRVQH